MKKSKFGSFKSKKISQLVSEGENLTNLENRILNHTYEYTMREDIVMYISGLLADLMNQKPVTAADFADLKGRILLILPDQDFFSGKMQQDLIALMHEPEIAYVSGGHLSTVVKADDYIRTIRAFLLPAGK